MADIKDIKNIPIIEYAQSNGFAVQKIGRYYTLKEHDSVRIDVDKNCFYQNSSGKRGSVIDFSMTFENKDLKTTLADLGEYLGNKDYKPKPISPQEKKTIEPKVFNLPSASDSNKQVYSYLTFTRRIDKDIVNELINNKNLYQSKDYNNCVFVSYDKNGKANFASLRGTSTYRKFIGDVSGSDYKHCFFLDNGSESLLVNESVIDSLSVMTATKLHGHNPKMFNYLSLSGATKIDAVTTQVKENPKIKTVIIALDNDEAGRTNAQRIHEALEEFPNLKVVDKFPTQAKDWNEELILTVQTQEKTNSKKIVKQTTQKEAEL